MKNLETLSKINSAMAEISQITTEFDLESARSQFVSAKNGIEQKAVLESAKAELDDNSSEALEAEINLLSLETEIDNRLKSLK